MQEENNSLVIFAGKVAKFCSKGVLHALACHAQKSPSKMPSHQTIRIPFMTAPGSGNSQLSTLFKPTPKSNLRVRSNKKISIELARGSKPISSHYRMLYQSAFHAYSACQNQDLHLFSLKKIYCERKTFSKKVINWKLSKPEVAKRHMRIAIDHRFDLENSAHHITRIFLDSSDLEEQKQVQELIELQKQLQEKRRFSRGTFSTNAF